MRPARCLLRFAFVNICCKSFPFVPNTSRRASSFVPSTTSRACNDANKSQRGPFLLETATNSNWNQYQINHDNQIDGHCGKPISRAVYVPPVYPMDENERPVDVPQNRHLLQVPLPTHSLSTEEHIQSNINAKINLQTPHSGRKFRPTHPSATKKSYKLRSWIEAVFSSPFHNHRRFTEGWYYRLTLPQYNESFVFIFSIEDAGRFIRNTQRKSSSSRTRKLFRSLRRKRVKSPLTLACMQLLGPQDTYLVQSHDDDTKFWAWKHAQGLGCTFHWKEPGDNHRGVAAMSPQEWRETVRSGFQNHGGNYYRQYSTAGWLASYPVFEPHWQITMAHARATGTLKWNGTLYQFYDAPFYGEKNWGGAFPTKWYWAQCNSFENHPDLAFTAGGGIRQLPFSFLSRKRTETLGMIGIHFNGTFYEIVPWTGEMEWKVWPWGRWEFRGRCTDKSGKQFEAEVVAFTEEDVSGVLLRAPTKDEGMQYFCRDSGFGRVTLSLWMLEWDDDIGDYVRKREQPLIDRAQSNQCAVEVGGGPWWDVWSVSSKMSSSLKWMVRLPYRLRNTLRRMG
ncbi:hypothetical protein ACHAW6_004907 [Cyclotella cf. meneghiniana]